MTIINSYINVNGGGSAPAHYVPLQVDANGVILKSDGGIDMTGVTTISANCFYDEFRNNTNVTTLFRNAQSVEQINEYACYNACYEATNLTSIGLTNLKYINGDYAFSYAFRNCSRLTNVEFFNTLITITGSNTFSGTFYHCTGLTTANFSNLTTINSTNCFNRAFEGCTGITSLLFNALTDISGNSCFQRLFNTYSGEENITNLQTVGFNSLKKITNTNKSFYESFYRCVNLTTTGLSNLEVWYGDQLRTFSRCSSLTTVGLPKLVSVGGGITHNLSQMFSYCTGIVNDSLPSLKEIISNYSLVNLFSYCTNLQTLSFPALRNLGNSTSQFASMLQGVTGCTVHFPSNLQSVISSWSDVTGGFGGTNTTVLFDLPATVILTGANSVNYERSPKDDTATALAWRVQDTGTTPNIIIDWTPYYTSGTTDPAVSDTIYSDSACTISVTTISAIA